MFIRKTYTDYFAVAEDMNKARIKGNLKDVSSIYRYIKGQKLSNEDKIALKLVNAIQKGDDKKVEQILKSNNVDVNYKLPIEMVLKEIVEKDNKGIVRTIRSQTVIKFTSPLKFAKERAIYKEHLGEDNQTYVAINKLLDKYNQNSTTDDLEVYEEPLF